MISILLLLLLNIGTIKIYYSYNINITASPKRGENEGAKNGRRGKVGRKKRKFNQRGKVIEESWGVCLHDVGGMG